MGVAGCALPQVVHRHDASANGEVKLHEVTMQSGGVASKAGRLSTVRSGP